jgi:hypothetical protein
MSATIRRNARQQTATTTPDNNPSTESFVQHCHVLEPMLLTVAASTQTHNQVLQRLADSTFLLLGAVLL